MKKKEIVTKNPLSFGNWLMLHKGHDTPIGDLARDAFCDPHFLPVCCTTSKMRELLNTRGGAALKALNVLNEAIESYLKYKLAVEGKLILKEVYEDNLNYYGYMCEKRAYTTD